LPIWKRIPAVWQTVIYIGSGIIAIGGAATIVITVVPMVEPWWVATRAHVSEKINPIDQKTDVLMYWKLDDQKNIAKREEGGWTIQLQKESDPKQKELIQKQIDRAVADQRKYDERVKQLKVPDWIK